MKSLEEKERKYVGKGYGGWDLKRVEHAIMYSENSDSYFVQFSFKNKGKLESFPSLEDARAYRDAVYAEKLRYKINRETARIREAEKVELAKIMSGRSETDVYPFNLIKSADIDLGRIDTEIMDNFDMHLDLAVKNDRAFNMITMYYGDESTTLDSIGEIYGLTRERIRQIIAKGLKMFRFYVYRYDADRARREKEAQMREIYAQRERLIIAAREGGLISEDATMLFGPFDVVDNKVVTDTKKYDVELADMDLSVRSYNCMRRAGLNSAKEICEYSEDDLRKVRNLGAKSLREIKIKLAELGFSLKGK